MLSALSEARALTQQGQALVAVSTPCVMHSPPLVFFRILVWVWWQCWGAVSSQSEEIQKQVITYPLIGNNNNNIRLRDEGGL